jgi:hypothetical protein
MFFSHNGLGATLINERHDPSLTDIEGAGHQYSWPRLYIETLMQVVPHLRVNSDSLFSQQGTAHFLHCGPYALTEQTILKTQGADAEYQPY